MPTYTATYGHSDTDTDTPGRLTLKATNDEDAKAELRKFVASGFRNQTWATLALQTGESLQVINLNGRAGCYIVPTLKQY